MKVTINSKNPPDLELFTDDETKDIVQNIFCILKTTRGSCPMLRDYGMDPTILHKPVQIAQAAFSVAIQKQMEEFEDRATLVRLEFDLDPQHPDILYPIMEVTIP